jgi:hypothetical protein
MLCAACVLLTYRSVGDIVGDGIFEHAPTNIHIANISSDHQGQRWLRITGQLVPSLASICWTHASSNTQPAECCVCAPIVPEDYKIGDPVYAIAVYGPAATATELHDQIRLTAEQGAIPITGTLGPPPDQFNRSVSLPGIPLGEHALFLRVDATPSLSGANIAMLIFALSLDAFCIWVLYRAFQTFRALLRSRKYVLNTAATPD